MKYEHYLFLFAVFLLTFILENKSYFILFLAGIGERHDIKNAMADKSKAEEFYRRHVIPERDGVIKQLTYIKEIIQNVTNWCTDNSIGLSFISAMGNGLKLLGLLAASGGLSLMLATAGTATGLFTLYKGNKNENHKKQIIKRAFAEALAIVEKFIKTCEIMANLVQEMGVSKDENGLDYMMHFLHKGTILFIDLKTIGKDLMDLYSFYASVDSKKIANMLKKQSNSMSTGSAVFEICWDLYSAEMSWLGKGTLCEEAKKIENVISKLRSF